MNNFLIVIFSIFQRNKMAHYRKKITKHSYQRATYASKLAPKKSSRYKQKLFGSGLALIFLLAILYGRSKHYTPQSQRPKAGEVDYSRPKWMERLRKIHPSSPNALPQNDNNLEALTLILKEYRYWEKEVHLAREANNKKKEEYALSNYRQAMEKIARYSDDAIKKAEEELEKSEPSQTIPLQNERSPLE
jgi:hypothetical protein